MKCLRETYFMAFYIGFQFFIFIMSFNYAFEFIGKMTYEIIDLRVYYCSFVYVVIHEVISTCYGILRKDQRRHSFSHVNKLRMQQPFMGVLAYQSVLFNLVVW